MLVIRFSKAHYLGTLFLIMAKRKVTSKQVAERAGVSQTTVSFVLNQAENTNISPETKQRVLQAARDLNYVPDVAARALARGRSNNIALVLSQSHQQVFIDEYIPKVITGLNQVTQQYGYRILVEMVDYDKRQNAYDNLVRGKEVAGIIVNFNNPPQGELDSLVNYSADFPIVSLGDFHPDLYTVTVDKYIGVRLMAQHLMSLGHRRIACISYGPQGDRHSGTRLEIFKEMLENAGVPFHPELVAYGAYDPETGYEAMQKLLKISPLPTAVWGMNDVMAFGAITAIYEHGLRVPEDIAVAGFDDIRMARFCTPPLTTVYEPDVDHGRLAGELLMNLINGKPPEQKWTILETQLVVRESCGAKLRGLVN